MNGSLDNITFDIKKLSTTPDGARYKVSIKVPMSMGFIERMKFIIESNNERRAFQLKHLKNENNLVNFETEIELATSAIYHYYFSFEANHNFIYFKKQNKTNNQTITPEEKWNLSVNFDTPEWAKGAVMYHIFVDRFNHSKKTPLIEMPNRTIHKSWDEDVLVGPDKKGIWNADFYGGNLKGIEEKLDYIKSLGVDIIYLSPIVMSQSNHRYDTADYEKVDPYAGTNKDLKDLCDKAHKTGMKVVLDAVFNHTGNDSKYFNQYGTYPEKGAFEGQDSKYYNFFRKHYANATTYFDYWWGMTNLPVCDGYSKEWQQYIYGEKGVIDLWFSLGIDGLRLDVADELTDEFIEGIRTAVKRNKQDGLIIGEVWKNPMRMGRGYIESGKGMDTVMDYVLVDALLRYFKYGDVTSIAEVIRQLRTEYPDGTLQTLMNFTSTHDITRAINLFGCDEFKRFNSWAWDLYNDNRDYQKNYRLSKEQYEYGKQLYKSYLYFLTFFPGILSIFYGDEVGMQGLGNLANRRPFPWGKEDKDLQNYLKYMGRIRKKEQFLKTADIDVFDINTSFILFERKTPEVDALIAINRTGDPIPTPLPEKYYNIDTIYPLGLSNTRSIDSHGGIVLKKVKK